MEAEAALVRERNQFKSRKEKKKKEFTYKTYWGGGRFKNFLCQKKRNR